MSDVPSKETIKRSTIKSMKELGVHKPEYNRLVSIYADLVYQYNLLTEQFEWGGYSAEVSTDQGGTKKSPILASLENLRKDILAYSDRLCLNPAAMKTIKVDKGKVRSGLAAALKDLE